MDRCHHTNIQIKAIENELGIEAAAAASASAQLLDASMFLASKCTENHESGQDVADGLMNAVYHLAAKHGLSEPVFQKLVDSVGEDFKASILAKSEGEVLQ